jgi:hypothetical protein
MCYCAKKEVLPPQEMGKMTLRGDILVTWISRQKLPFPGLNSAPQYQQKQGWINRMPALFISTLEPVILRSTTGLV